MCADLFESYVGSIISSIALAWALGAVAAQELWGVETESFDVVQRSLVLFPVLLAGVGVLCSILGTFTVRTKDEKAIQSALFRGLFTASVLVVLGASALVVFLGIPYAVLYCVITGLVVGVIFG